MQHKCMYKYLYTVQRTMKFIFAYLLVSLSIVSYAQLPETNPTANFGNHWIFGRNVHLEFSDDTIYQYEISDMDWLEGTGNYSDSSDTYYIGKSSSGEFLRKVNSTIFQHLVFY